MAPHLGLQRIMIPSAQVSSLTTGSITLPSARGAFSAGAFDSIATYTASNGDTTVTFSSIPQTYKYLQLRSLAKFTNLTGTDITHYMKFNNDSGTNYSWHNFNGYGVGASLSISPNGVTSTSDGMGYAAFPTSNSTFGNIWGFVVTEIFNYSDSNMNTVIRSYGGDDGNTTYQNLDFRSGAWYNASAVTTITLGTTSLVAGSQFALYGIKG